MTDKSTSDKGTLARATVGRMRQSAVNVLMRTPFYRMRLMGPRAVEVLFVPQDLRTMDPTFLTEIEHGHMGLAGFVVDLAGRSPFDVPDVDPTWQEGLHAFSWLRHLRAARDEGGDILAKRLVTEWIDRHPSPRGRAFEPATNARRILSWLCNASLLLENANAHTYATILRSLDMQMQHLATSYGQAPAGLGRLHSLMALVYAGLCIADQERLIELHQPAFFAELDAQIPASGGHISRSSSGLIDLLIDLLPLAQCFVARGRPIPERLQVAIGRIFPWLRYMRMGDGQLARFHGGGAPMAVDLATVLAFDDRMVPLQASTALGYVRAQGGRTVVLMDAGRPPPVAFAHEAHAGCLSFELSSAGQLVVVNCGPPPARDKALREVARSTAAHSTLAIDGASSSQLVTSRLVASRAGSLTVLGPGVVRAQLSRLPDGAIDIETAHDGYMSRFAVEHARSLRLSADGRTLDGRDRLGNPDPNARISGDLAFGIHFHLHPEVDGRLAAPGCAELTLPSGETWRLSVRGMASLAFEESQFFGDPTGPKRSQQIVLRGRCLDQVEVHWRLEQTVAPAAKR